MSSAEYSGPQGEGRSQHRQDLPQENTPAERAGSAGGSPLGPVVPPSWMVPHFPRPDAAARPDQDTTRNAPGPGKAPDRFPLSYVAARASGGQAAPPAEGGKEHTQAPEAAIDQQLGWLKAYTTPTVTAEATPKSGEGPSAALADDDPLASWEKELFGKEETPVGALEGFFATQRTDTTVVEQAGLLDLVRPVDSSLDNKTPTGKFSAAIRHAEDKPATMLVDTEHTLTIPGVEGEVIIAVNLDYGAPGGEDAGSHVSSVEGHVLDERGGERPDVQAKLVEYMKAKVPNAEQLYDTDLERAIWLASAAEQARHASAQEFTTEDFDSTEVKKLPEGAKAVVKDIESAENRLKKTDPPFAIPEENTVARVIDASADQPVTPKRVEHPETGDKLRGATGRAVYELERMAADMLGEGENAAVPTANNSNTLYITTKPIDNSTSTEDSPSYFWFDGQRDGEQARRLIIESIKSYRFADPTNPEMPHAGAVAAFINFDVVGNGEVRFVGATGKYLDADTLAPDKAMEEAFFAKYGKEDPRGGISAEEAKEAFLVSLVFSEMESAYTAHRAEQKQVIFDVPGVTQEKSGQEAEVQLSERAVAVQDARDNIFSEVSELIKLVRQQADGSVALEAKSLGEGIISMIELTAKVKQSTAKTTDHYDSLEAELAAFTNPEAEHDKPTISDFIEALEALPGIPVEFLIRAYVADSEIFNSNDSQIKLRPLLAEEKEARLHPKNDESAGAPEYLQTIVEECARLGKNPNGWIKEYALNNDEKWRLNALYHYTADLEGSNKLDAHLFGLTRREATSAQMAYLNTALALATSKNPALDIALMQQFPEVANNAEITVHNVDQLFAVAQQVLLATTREMLDAEGNITIVKEGELSEVANERQTLVGQIDDLIDATRRSPKGMFDERSALIDALDQGQFTWRMSIKAIRGDKPEEILENIAEQGYGVRIRNAVLDAVATQFAAHGDFESAQKVLAHMRPVPGDTPIESGYVHVWNRAGSLDDVAHVDPAAQKSEIIFDPLLSADYVSLVALHSGNINVMKQVALDVASDLQTSETTGQEREQQWNILEQFVNKVKEVAGKEDAEQGNKAAVQLSRDIFSVFNKAGAQMNLEEMGPIINVLSKKGEPSDWDNIRELISSQPISDIEKIRLLARLAQVLEE